MFANYYKNNHFKTLGYKSDKLLDEWIIVYSMDAHISQCGKYTDI